MKYDQEKEKTLHEVPINEMINFNENDEDIKVSVIIPVYNVEEYLDECISSVLNQSLQDIEIICVNDGSTDNSLNILKSYADKDKRIRIVDKDNAGYGHSMNIGMDLASGEYIGIVESDDYVLPEMFEYLYSYAKEYDLDFVKSNFNRFYGENEDITKQFNKIAFEDNNYNIILKPSENKECFRFIMNTWSGIYKTNFLRKYNIRHHETSGASFQDNGFWFKANIYAEKTMYLPEAYYMNRRDNPNSSVNDEKKVYCANKEFKLIYDYLDENNLKDEFLDVYNLKRFHNYMFTLERIHPKYRKEYIKAISDEFKQSKEKNEIKSDFYSVLNCNEIRWILENPEDYYYQVWHNRYKVSVILPVYNMERYLSKCLDTLLNQSLRDIEIICINDGSKDDSLKILKKYQSKDKRIKIINQKNQGAGVARNKGMELATGEYISFLDADDFFDVNMLKHSYEKSKENNADICIFEAFLFDNITQNYDICTFNVKKEFLPKQNVFNRTHVSSNIFKNIMGWPWDKLYKRSFIESNHLKFQEQRTTNDMYFVYISLIKASRICILEEALVYQRRNVPTSLSSTRELSWDCFYHALMKIKEELIKMNIYDEYKQDFVNYALVSCLWNFNSLKEPSARKLFHKLRSGWFSSLDILGHDEDYFENKYDYKQLCDIMALPEDDYNAYYDYQINLWKTKGDYNYRHNIKNIPIDINEHEQLTVNEMISKLEWYRNKLNEMKKGI
ncbi:MAG: hypothetical protein BZ137_09215 [Methanosphaera sp. rholeuAM130]|nr:MAG: hypothetical protein BZ137_09215 [Methanosphaera sp. rholeuAM130]